jgi:hypothetical protein
MAEVGQIVHGQFGPPDETDLLTKRTASAETVPPPSASDT